MQLIKEIMQNWAAGRAHRFISGNRYLGNVGSSTLEHEKVRALKLHMEDYEASLTASTTFRKISAGGLITFIHTHRHFETPTPEKIIFTDSSKFERGHAC